MRFAWRPIRRSRMNLTWPRPSGNRTTAWNNASSARSLNGPGLRSVWRIICSGKISHAAQLEGPLRVGMMIASGKCGLNNSTACVTGIFGFMSRHADPRYWYSLNRPGCSGAGLPVAGVGVPDTRWPLRGTTTRSAKCRWERWPNSRPAGRLIGKCRRYRTWRSIRKG